MYCNIFIHNNSESTILIALDKEKNIKSNSTHVKYYLFDRLEPYFETHTHIHTKEKNLPSFRNTSSSVVMDMP